MVLKYCSSLVYTQAHLNYNHCNIIESYAGTTHTHTPEDNFYYKGTGIFPSCHEAQEK